MCVWMQIQMQMKNQTFCIIEITNLRERGSVADAGPDSPSVTCSSPPLRLQSKRSVYSY